MNKGSSLISNAIIGFDRRTCVVNNKCYTINPPTIRVIAGAGKYLSQIKDGDTVRDLILSMEDIGNIAHALSWFIAGDDSLAEEFKDASFEDVVDALEVAFSLISVENFLKLSVLMKSVLNLIAKQK